MNTDQALPEAQRHDSSDADVVLEAGDHVGHTWRPRWTSLTLFTRAEYDGLPGRPFPAPAGSYPGKDAVADRVAAA